MDKYSKTSSLNQSEDLKNVLDLNFDRKSYVSDKPLLNLIGFCLHKLGTKNIELVSDDGLNIRQLLELNDIYYRQVICPSDLSKQEFPLLITQLLDSNYPVAIYRSRGSNCLYSSELNLHRMVTKEDKFMEIGYEIYSSLPATINGPLEIVRFGFRKEKESIFSLLITSAFVMLFNLSIPILTNTLINRILPESDVKLIFDALIAVSLIVAGSIASLYLQNRMMLRLESVTDLRLQSSVWDRLIRLPISFISKYTVGDLASRVESISQIRQLMGSGVLSTLLSTLFSVSFFFLMFTYDKGLAIWATAFTLLAIICLLSITLSSIRLQEPLLKESANLTNFTLQAIKGLAQIRSAGAEPFILLRWLRRINKYVGLRARESNYNDLLEMYGTLSVPISSILLFAVVITRLTNASSPEEFNSIIVAYVSFNAAFISFNSALTRAVNLVANTVTRSAVLWRRAEPIIYAELENGYQPGALKMSLTGEFTFEDVHYSFPNSNNPIYNGVSFRVLPEKQTAITGPSGCGKSTLIKMLLGFIEPNRGTILVDNVPLKKLSIRHYRRQLGVVMQTPLISGGSIFDIVTGGMMFTEEEVWESLERASIATEIHALPMKLETIINPSGGNMSGGQIQRIEIARAFITKPKVLIMDEATSALDNKSQEAITNTIKEMGITRITIAHRLSTIREADQIIVLQGGRIRNQGTWNEINNLGYIRDMQNSKY